MKKSSIVLRALDWGIRAIPIVLLLVAVAADALGLEADGKWGAFRIGLLLLGTVGTVVVISLLIAEILDRRLGAGLWPFRLQESESRSQRQPGRESRRSVHSLGSPVGEISEASEPDSTKSRGHASSRPAPRGLQSHTIWHKTKRWFPLGLIFLAVEMLYVFFVSAGYWFEWPDTTRFYDLQAEAFLHGDTALGVEPSPQLLALENPYDPKQLTGVPYLFDAAYFNGRYYMYWGPTPAAVAALWRLATGTGLGDKHVVFVATSTMLLFSLLILLYLRRSYFSSLPSWLLSMGLVAVGTASPILWVLNWPTIYPAAVVSAQAFLLAGLYVALPLLDRTKSQTWRYLLAGVLWALALGCRLTIAVGVAVLALSVSLNLLARSSGRRTWPGALLRIAALALPLVIGIGLLGMYNYIRFGDFLEVGQRYTLSRLDMDSIMRSGRYFNVRYLLPNTAYYLVGPLLFRPSFPFVLALRETLPTFSSLFAPLALPPIYHVEEVTGILFSMPAIVFVGPLLRACLGRRPNGPARTARIVPAEPIHRERDSSFQRICLTTLVAGIAAGIPVAVFFWVTTRYLLDALPLVALTAVAGSWQFFSARSRSPAQRNIAAAIIVLAVIVGMIVGLLLAMSSSASRLDDLNPALWGALTDFFSWK